MRYFIIVLTFIVVIIKTSIYKLCHAEKKTSHVLSKRKERSTDDDDEDSKKKEKFHNLEVFLYIQIKVS